MKVTLSKAGGWTAGMRLPPQVVDSAQLPRKDADELARLVRAATAAPSIESGPGQARDALSYTITIEDRGKPAVLHASDVSKAPEVAALLDWIEKQKGK
jgi:hypothetical protein